MNSTIYTGSHININIAIEIGFTVKIEFFHTIDKNEFMNKYLLIQISSSH